MKLRSSFIYKQLFDHELVSKHEDVAGNSARAVDFLYNMHCTEREIDVISAEVSYI